MTDELKQLRIGIDRIAQLVNQMRPVDLAKELDYPLFSGALPLRSPQIVSCYNSLLLAKAWLGTLLGELGNETPYKNDGNRHEVKDIEPTDAKAIVPTVDESTVYGQKNNVEKVDYLRQEIKKCVDALIDLPKMYADTEADAEVLKKCVHIKNNAYTHLYEARFHLGFELQRLKNDR